MTIEQSEIDLLMSLSRKALQAWERNSNGRNREDFDLLKDCLTDELRAEITALIAPGNDVDPTIPQTPKASEEVLNLIQAKQNALNETRRGLAEKYGIFYFMNHPNTVSRAVSTTTAGVLAIPITLAIFFYAKTFKTSETDLFPPFALFAAAVVPILANMALSFFIGGITAYFEAPSRIQESLSALSLIQAAVLNNPYKPNERVSVASSTGLARDSALSGQKMTGELEQNPSAPSNW